jgi:hypothetical protein
MAISVTMTISPFLSLPRTAFAAAMPEMAGIPFVDLSVPEDFREFFEGTTPAGLAIAFHAPGDSVVAQVQDGPAGILFERHGHHHFQRPVIPHSVV